MRDLNILTNYKFNFRKLVYTKVLRSDNFFAYKMIFRICSLSAANKVGCRQPLRSDLLTSGYFSRRNPTEINNGRRWMNSRPLFVHRGDTEAIRDGTRPYQRRSEQVPDHLAPSPCPPPPPPPPKFPGTRRIDSISQITDCDCAREQQPDGLGPAPSPDVCHIP